MFGFGKKKKEAEAAVAPAAAPATTGAGEVVVAPAAGSYKQLSTVSDPIFAQGTLGDGFAVQPSGGAVVAPVSGTIKILHDTLHAFAIQSDGGAEVLVHIGIDTVELEGRGFKALVAKGDTVEAGQPIVEVDWAAVEPEVPSTEVMVVVTNGKKFALNKTNDSEHAVAAGDPVATAAPIA